MAVLAIAGQPFCWQALADEGRTPAALQPDDRARPISASSSTQNRSGGVTARWSSVQKHRVGSSTALRWREPTLRGNARRASATSQPQQRQQTSQVAPATLVWGQDAPSPRRSPVRLVTQLGPLDPFDDPFGDRRPAINQPTNNRFTTPTGIQPVPEFEDDAAQPLDPPAELADPPGSDFRLPSTAPEADAVPQVEPDAMPLPQVQPQDAPFAPVQPDAQYSDSAPIPPQDLSRQSDTLPAPLQPVKPCDRVYNNRDCCEEDEECKRARTFVVANTLDKISLNISPSFKPDARTAIEGEQARTLRLAESEIRSWRNRKGEVVARGQVTDLQFGRVYIEGDGQVTKIPVRQLSDDDWCFLAAWWGVPTECSLGDEEYRPRDWIASTMTWKASALCNKPVYFEEVQLERYGHTAGPFLQPAISGAHFFLNIATLPYKMGINPPNECRYALGYYRPGDCAPWLLPPVPLSIRGGLMQAGIMVGGVYIFP